MNLSTAHKQSTTFRFRRWSRKGYAAFFSLRRTVTIGQLSANVSERFQIKNCSLHAVAGLSGESCTISDENSCDFDEENVSLSSLPPAAVSNYLSVTIAQGTAAANVCPDDTNYIYYNRTESRQHDVVCFPFFMLITKQRYDNRIT